MCLDVRYRSNLEGVAACSFYDGNTIIVGIERARHKDQKQSTKPFQSSGNRRLIMRTLESRFWFVAMTLVLGMLFLASSAFADVVRVGIEDFGPNSTLTTF